MMNRNAIIFFSSLLLLHREKSLDWTPCAALIAPDTPVNHSLKEVVNITDGNALNESSGEKNNHVELGLTLVITFLGASNVCPLGGERRIRMTS